MLNIRKESTLRMTHFIVYLQLLILGVCLQYGCSVDEGLCLDSIVILQVQPCDLQVCLQLVVCGILPAQ